MEKQKKLYTKLEEEFGYKIKRYREKWNKAKNNIPEYPLHLNFELTAGCNLKCEMCLHSLPFKKWSYKVEPKKNISFNKYKKIINEGVKYGLYSIELNGINEPLFKKDIFKYINYAKKQGILIISLHTNGILLTEKMSKSLINSGLTLIIFSLDAYKEETYKKIRIKSNYKQVIKNILKFLEIKKNTKNKFPLTKVSFSQNKINNEELPSFLEFWDKKIDFYSTSYFCNPFIGKDNYQEIEKKYKLENNIDFNCYEPYTRLLIQNNGNVCPCCSFFAGEIIIGNIYNNSIYEIWNSNNMKKMRLNIKNLQACEKCRLSKK